MHEQPAVENAVISRLLIEFAFFFTDIFQVVDGRDAGSVEGAGEVAETCPEIDGDRPMPYCCPRSSQYMAASRGERIHEVEPPTLSSTCNPDATVRPPIVPRLPRRRAVARWLEKRCLPGPTRPPR